VRPQLKRAGRNRWYVDLDSPVPGQAADLDPKKVKYQRIPGVTTIVRNGMPKEALMNYAGTATADYAVNNWEELSALPAAERLSRLNKGRYESRDNAAQRGQQVHQLAQKLVRDQEVPVPPELEGYVAAAVRFMDEFAIEPIVEELTVFSPKHYYCGTLDLGAYCEIPDLAEYEWIPLMEDGRARGLFDYKLSRSGIWGDVAYQLAPYRFAEFCLMPDGEGGFEIDSVPEFDFAAGVHLRPDGTYSVIPVECEIQQFEDFLTIMANAAVVDRSKDLILSEIIPPRTSRFRLTKTAEAAS
jgi:hypothetical protein